MEDREKLSEHEPLTSVSTACTSSMDNRPVHKKRCATPFFADFQTKCKTGKFMKSTFGYPINFQPIRSWTETKSRLGRARFPALSTGSMFLFRALIGSLGCLRCFPDVATALVLVDNSQL